MIDVTTASVMILDDEPANVRFLTRLLERKGHTRVRGHTSAGEALASLRGEPADLLVLRPAHARAARFTVMDQLRQST